MLKFYECECIYTDSFLPERFKKGDKWIYSISQGMYYIEEKYFTNDEFNRYFKIIE